MDDEKNGGQIYISIKGMKTNLLSSKASGRFTLKGMTSETGETGLFIWILDTHILSVTDIKGPNYCASISYGSSKTMEEKM